MMFATLLLIGCLYAPTTLGSPIPSGKNILNIPFAAGTALLPNPTNPDQLDLVVNTFEPAPSTTDEIYVVRDIVGQIANGNDGLFVEVLAEGLIWPSTVETVPRDVFNSDDFYFTPGGFILPSKDIGSVTLIDAATNEFPAETIDLTRKDPPDTVWFKKAIFVDVDNDGRKDILAAKTDTTDRQNVKTALVWFKHPDEDPLTTRWEENVLFEDAGPNFQYRVFKLSPTVTRHAIFTTQLFGQSLEVRWNDVIIDSSESEEEEEDNSDEEDDDDDNAPDFFSLTRRIIENEGGNSYFDSTIADINGDGKMDILATVSSTTNGKLVAYEIPEDWENGEFTQHVLADGFKPPEPNPRPGRGSPGRAQIFDPDNEPRNKPFILMTGDDDGKVYVVKPINDADPSDWSYKADVVFEAAGNTIGDLTFADVNGDGLAEIFVPVFNAGQVHVVPYEDLDLQLENQEIGVFSSSDSSGTAIF